MAKATKSRRRVMRKKLHRPVQLAMKILAHLDKCKSTNLPQCRTKRGRLPGKVISVLSINPEWGHRRSFVLIGR